MVSGQGESVVEEVSCNATGVGKQCMGPEGGAIRGSLSKRTA